MGRLVHLDKGKYLKEMARFLREIEFDQHGALRPALKTRRSGLYSS